MSVVSVASALTTAGSAALVAGWMADQSSGTLGDFGANTLPLTVGARGTYGTNGSQLITETARALTATGSAGSGSVATRAVTAGTPLQLANGFTLVGFVKPTSLNVARGLLGGRLNNWQVRHSSTGTVQGFVWVGGVAKQLTMASTLQVGKTYMIHLSFDGTDIELGVNATIERRLNAPGTITATTDSFLLGDNGSGASFDGAMQGVMVFNRKLWAGELRSLLLEGDPAFDAEGASGFTDYVADSIPHIASRAFARFCGVCGGRMRAGERAATLNAHGTRGHAGCVAIGQKTAPTITNASSQSDYVAAIERWWHDEFLPVISRRTPGAVTAEKNGYYDGTRFRNTLLDALSAPSGVNAPMIGAGSATLAHMVGAPRHDPMVELARQQVELQLTTFPTTYFSQAEALGGDFWMPAVGQAILMLRPRMDAATNRRWARRFQELMTYLFKGGSYRGRSTLEANNAKNYYINGNREIAWCLALWLAYAITEDEAWLAEYTARKAWLIGPTGSLSPLSPYLPTLNGGSVYGWKQQVAPGSPDSTGKGWFREWNAAHNGFFSYTDATVFLDGLDWGYLQLATRNALATWLISGDASWIPYVSGMRNKAMERVNQTGSNVTGSNGTDTIVPNGGYDARNGTRQNVLDFWANWSDHALKWRGGRSDLTDTWLAANFNAGIANTRSNVNPLGEGPARDYSHDISSLLIASSDWPGTPA